MKLNGMVSLVLRLAQMERFFKTVFVIAHKVNLNKKENVLTTQFAKMEPNGMVNNVQVFHATLVLHSAVVAVVVKPQFTLALLELIGMVTDAST